MNAALRLSTRRVLRDTQADDGGTGSVAVGLLRAGGSGNVQVVDRQTDRQTDSSEQTYRRGARRSGGRDAHRRRRRGSSCTGELFIVCVWWLWLATAVAVLPLLLPRVTPVLGMPSPRESSPTTPSSPLRTRALSPSLPLPLLKQRGGEATTTSSDAGACLSLLLLLLLPLLSREPATGPRRRGIPKRTTTSCREAWGLGAARPRPPRGRAARAVV